MNDKEIISEFIQVKKGNDGIQLLVRDISWPHPHEPVSSWTVASILPQTSSSQELDLKIQAILQNKQYFQVCQEWLELSSGEIVATDAIAAQNLPTWYCLDVEFRLRGHLQTQLRALQGRRFRAYGSVSQNPVWRKVARYVPTILSP